MEICFFRHGEAEPAGMTATDAERQLTETGRQDTRLVAEMLRRTGLSFTRLHSSPLIRARQTADILGGIFDLSAEVTERLRAGCGLGDVQQLLADQRQGHFLLVGHEPDCGQIVSQLIGGGRLRMATSGIACVQTDRVEPGAGRLMWLVTPEVAPAG
jgi:phosphohistidine phosphatase